MSKTIDSQMRGVFQWRRGLVLAGIHLVICVPLIVWEEASRWDWVRSQENLPPLELARPVPPPPPDAVKPADEGETITFSPCGMWHHMSLPQRIIVMGELPAVLNRSDRPDRTAVDSGGWVSVDSSPQMVLGTRCAHHHLHRHRDSSVVCAISMAGLAHAACVELLQGGYRGVVFAWRFFRRNDVETPANSV